MLNPVQLEKALNGEHVILESGETAIIIADIRKHKPDAEYPIIGYILDDDGIFVQIMLYHGQTKADSFNMNLVAATLFA